MTMVLSQPVNPSQALNTCNSGTIHDNGGTKTYTNNKTHPLGLPSRATERYLPRHWDIVSSHQVNATAICSWEPKNSTGPAALVGGTVYSVKQGCVSAQVCERGQKIPVLFHSPLVITAVYEFWSAGGSWGDNGEIKNKKKVTYAPASMNSTSLHPPQHTNMAGTNYNLQKHQHPNSHGY